MKKKSGIMNTVMAMLLIAGMCIPAPAAYAAEEPTETVIAVEAETETEENDVRESTETSESDTETADIAKSHFIRAFHI